MKPRWFAAFTGLLPLFMLAHFGHHLVNSLPIPLLPMIRRDFGLDYTQSGLLVSAFTLSYGLSQIPSGWLADRIGARILITIGICGVAAAGLLVGLSPNYSLLILFSVLMGVLGGGYHPAAPPLITAAVAPQNRGKAMGLHMSAGSIPFFLAPLIAAGLASAWGWRGTIITLAAATMFFGIFFYIALGRLNSTENSEDKPNHSSNDGTPSVQRNPRRLVPFIIISTTTHAVTFSVIAFIPLFLIDLFGLGEKTAPTFLSIFYSAGLWASLWGGSLSDRFGGVPVLMAACFIAGPAIYLMSLMPSSFGIGFLLFILGICNYVRTPVSEAYIVSQTSQQHRSTILGIYYFSNLEGGGVLTPVMGFLIDVYGFYFGFSVAGIALVVLSVICLIWIRRYRN